MAKRHLSDQQKRRIATRHDNLIMGGSAEELPGLVLAHRGKQLEVETPSGQIVICHARQNIGSIVAGDEIRWCRETDEIGVVVARAERRSVLTRPDLYKQEKIIAANVDQMVIILSAEGTPIWHFLDKYLVGAVLQGFSAIIVLNKIDISVDLLSLRETLAIYQKIGIACYEISCQNQTGLQAIAEALLGKTNIFVGQSGAGKSSLINALLQKEIAKTKEISSANNKGQHTTTTARLYHFPTGGNLIDSPGIREFGLWHINKAQVLLGFKEINAYAGLCKFRDCGHNNTKGCAVEAAVNAGEIHPLRLQSYHRIISQLE